MTPPVRYARDGDLSIAYQVLGGPGPDLLFVPGFASHLDLAREEPFLARFLRGLGGDRHLPRPGAGNLVPAHRSRPRRAALLCQPARRGQRRAARVIHTVQALDDQDAVSLHGYGTDIVTQERSMFDLDGRSQPYRPTFE